MATAGNTRQHQLSGAWFHRHFNLAVAICRLFERYIEVPASYIKGAVRINSIDSIIEPIFTEITSETVTAELQAQLYAALAAIPPAHRLNPSRDEGFESKETTFTRL